MVADLVIPVIKISPGLREHRSDSKRYLDVQIVDRCQLECLHCYLKKKNNIMPFGMFKDICEDFLSIDHPLKEVDIILSGGEPLLHPQFPKIIEFMRGIRLPVRLSSNGLLIPKYMDLFEKFDGIQVSIDGDESLHDFIRGNGVYKQAVHALRLLDEAHIPHAITFVACKENLHCVDSVIELCRETGTACLNVSSLQPINAVGLTPIPFGVWTGLRRSVREKAPDLAVPYICRETECIAGVYGLTVQTDGTYLDCALNQQVIGKYPTPIRRCLLWDCIDSGTFRDQFTTCQRGGSR